MELSQFAEQILFGSKLSDKLVAPSSTADFTDFSPGKCIDVPEFPGRSQGLVANRSGKAGIPGSSKSERFPGRSAFESDTGRGMVLHFFANHELLALELMALALLRFPDAPAEFRLGIARTMIEEQSHLMLYIQRMKELGVEFGQMPVNSFFWNCLSPMRSPMEYVTQLSMTFEQANVDFAAHYRDIFTKIGDQSTAKVLDQVYRDEIGHVKYGVSWFEKWRDPDQTQWDAWVSHLNFPVTPSRARGIGFVESARRAMGFSDDYIETLKIFSQSKGRQPKVFLFRPGFEEEMARWDTNSQIGDEFGKAKAALTAIEADLSPLLMFLGHSDDVVMVPEQPSDGWKVSIKEAGFDLPRFVVTKDLLTNPDRFAPSGFRSFNPWGWSPATLNTLAPIAGKLLSAKTTGAAARALWTRYTSMAEAAPIYASKSFLKVIRESAEKTGIDDDLAALNSLTYFCRTVDDLAEARKKIQEAGFGQMLIKPALAASGRGHIRLATSSVELPGNLFADQSTYVAEPLYDRVCDFSIQMTVHDDGTIQEHGIVRLLCDDRGQYKGHVIRKTLGGLDRSLTIAVNSDDWFGQLRSVARQVGMCLASAGYVGPYGIDSFGYRAVSAGANEAAYTFRPLVEVNARYTMGRIALELERSIPHGSVGLWRHFSRHEVKKMGFRNFPEFFGRLSRPEGAKVIATNAPETARILLSVLVTGKSLAGCEAIFSSANLCKTEVTGKL